MPDLINSEITKKLYIFSIVILVTANLIQLYRFFAYKENWPISLLLLSLVLIPLGITKISRA